PDLARPDRFAVDDGFAVSRRKTAALTLLLSGETRARVSPTLQRPRASAPENDGSTRPQRECVRVLPGRTLRVLARDGADGVHETPDLALHLREASLQVEDHLDPGEVHAEVARQRQDDLEALDRLL